jgi:hypothetical protein
MKIRPVGVKLLHVDRQTGVQTDIHDEVNICFSQFYESAYKYEFCQEAILWLRIHLLPSRT